jgi:hypothetical protein
VIFEIINPSDPYVIESPDPMVAMVATLLLGDGAYALRDERGEDPGLPLFLFGGDPNAWVVEKAGADLESYIDSHGPALVAALESVHIGRIEDEVALRETLADLPEEARATFMAKRHDKRRTSLNDIGGRAQAWAQRLRETTRDPGEGMR